MLNKHKLQRIAIATSALMAFGTTQLSANAETVTITGSITGPTCVLGQSAGGGAITNFTVGLGSVLLSSAASGNAGTTFDTKKTLDFALTAAGGGVCPAFGTTATGWDIAIAPAKSGFLKTIGSSTFLSNMIGVAEGGTNAVVKLMFVPIDLNKPQTLNKALNQDDGKTLTLGIRYVASRSLLSEVASLQAANPGSQDVTAGNVSVFLPFLLKLN